MLASAAGGFAAYAYTTRRYGKPDLTMICNGLLAGLVAITAPCAFVAPPFAVLIGAVAGVLVVVASLFVERVLKVDDPVGAVAVHGVNGAWGVIALGLFANGKYGDKLNGVEGMVTGYFYGDRGQLAAQCIGVVANFVYVASVTALALFVIDRIVGNRSSTASQIGGLDAPDMGMEAYPGDMGGHRAQRDEAPLPEEAGALVLGTERGAR
jgi:Amt family ammonium transporter